MKKTLTAICLITLLSLTGCGDDTASIENLENDTTTEQPADMLENNPGNNTKDITDREQDANKNTFSGLDAQILGVVTQITDTEISIQLAESPEIMAGDRDMIAGGGRDEMANNTTPEGGQQVGGQQMGGQQAGGQQAGGQQAGGQQAGGQQVGGQQGGAATLPADGVMQGNMQGNFSEMLTLTDEVVTYDISADVIVLSTGTEISVSDIAVEQYVTVVLDDAGVAITISLLG